MPMMPQLPSSAPPVILNCSTPRDSQPVSIPRSRISPASIHQAVRPAAPRRFLLWSRHSRTMHPTHCLTDVYGPRLTGSPNHKAAADWAIKQMTEWGFQNAHLEPWDFGHPGCRNERASGYIVEPILDQLTFRVLAWTPSTKGTVKAECFQMIPPEKPKKEDLTAYLNSIKDK